MVSDELIPYFSRLFSGLDTAFGTGKGSWVKRPPAPHDFRDHLHGRGPGIGIAPLRPDNTVLFAAIDLDEPDFDAAREMQQYIPGASWIEKSRSGNAHIWVFFSDPIEAWVPMGILKEAVLAAGKKGVEVFPKNHDFSRVKLGNYINLPYHGDQRPILRDEPLDDVDCEQWHPDLLEAARREKFEYPVEEFIAGAQASLSDPREWRKKAAWLMIDDPGQRVRTSEFGSQKNLHICAQHIIDTCEDNPVREGHRNAVYFALSKQLTNWEQVDHDEAWSIIQSVNECSLPQDKVADSELRRILANAERGQYTSTGCDDPLFLPYAHPSCPIAFPRS